MAVQNFTPAPNEVDLDATAELPIIDFAGVADDLASTDVHVTPGIPAGVADLAASLREAELRLARKMERVAGLEADLANALQSATQLRGRLEHESAQAARHEGALHAAEQQLARTTQRVAQLETELANAQRSAVELRAKLDQDSTQAARNEKSLLESGQQLALKTERAAELQAELAVAQRSAVELRAKLDQDSAQAARNEKSLLESGQQLALKTERLAQLETQLANVQRSMVELRAKLDQDGAQVAQRETALLESGQQLALKTQRAAALEAELAAEQRAVKEQRALLDEERSQGAQREQQARVRTLALEQQLAEQRQQLAAREAGQRQLAQDLLDLRRRNERALESLRTWQGFRGAVNAQIIELEARLDQVSAQHAAQLLAAQAHSAQMQAQAEARTAQQQEQAQAHAAQLQGELLAARIAAQERVTALEESMRVAQAAHAADKAELESQRQLTQSLQAQLDQAAAKSVRVEEDLRMAEEHIHRLESEAHASATLLGNLQQNIERLARDDTGSRPALRVVTTEPVPRVLIAQVDGAEVVYPLGRRTTIGRTPDNDIQIDTTFISRHHAVLLSNHDQCVVEDLNSTNGIMINGRPVSRQALRDGDLLTVGKSEFRFQQRA
jgi:chromosome segregation ATPase